ncbi:hypothetical protein BGZ60DRAFT_397534 [Tricladium varicosporioides]|nr:hypothetical protein BGZ60DRAFT_397534 [Hymenoscyphus varicosporioides]
MATTTSLKQAWKQDEDWTGISSRVERKKIQNRLNQRAHRKKNGQKETKSKKGGFLIERFRIVELPSAAENGMMESVKEAEPPAIVPANGTIPSLMESFIVTNPQDDSPALLTVGSEVEVPLNPSNCETSLNPESWTIPSLLDSLGQDSVSLVASIDMPLISDPLPNPNHFQLTPFVGIPPLADLVDEENESHMAVMQVMFGATSLDSTDNSSQSQPTASHAWSPNGTHSSFTFPLSSDHLLHLIHHNVFRALTANKTILSQSTIAQKLDYSVLRLSTKTICDGVSVVLCSEGQPIPPALYPTHTQKTISHPSYINMFPFPKFRDNLIRYQDSFNPYELCNDLFGEIVRENGSGAFGSVRMGTFSDVDESESESDGLTWKRTGMIVWGESWDPDGWEVTPKFLRKWSWLLGGCEGLIRSSNRWRVERGENPIDQRTLAPLSHLFYA